MKPRNKHRSLVLASTFVGMICGLVLTHQQAYAAQTPPVINQDNQITALSVPDNNFTTSGDQQSYNVLEPLASQDQNWNGQLAFDSTVNIKTVTRIINVHNPDGTLKIKK